MAVIVSVLFCSIAATRSAIKPSAARGTVVIHNLAAFAINVVSVAIPGRFDSDVTPDRMDFPWPTLFAPAGFAFAIWGVIYLGELVGLAALVRSAAIAERAAPASRAWLCANAAQALWCASFRPWALDRLWLSALCLSATAWCLLLSQLQLVHALRQTQASLGWSLLVAPRSLHCGWTTAATLVNVNAWMGSTAPGPPVALATAMLSIVAGVGLADLYTRLGVPMAAAAIAWALFAVGCGEPTGADALALGQPALEGLALSAGGAAALSFLLLSARCLLGSPAPEKPAGSEGEVRRPPSSQPANGFSDCLGSFHRAPTPRNATDALAFAPRMGDALAFAPAAPPEEPH